MSPPPVSPTSALSLTLSKGEDGWPSTSATAVVPRFVEVLVDCPGTEKLFTYEIPSGLVVQPGDILSVPFGRQQMGAIAIHLLTQPSTQLASKSILAVTDVVCATLFPPGYWPVLEQVAQYYHTSLMAVVRVALPPGLLQRSQRRIRLLTAALPDPLPTDLGGAAQGLLALLQRSPSQDYSWQYLCRQIQHAQQGWRELQQRGWVESFLQIKVPTQTKQQQLATLISAEDPSLSQRQREILTLLKQAGGELWLQDLLRLAQTTSTTLKKLDQQGYLAITRRERLRLETSPIRPDQPQKLTAAQAQALEVIDQLRGYAEVLLHGVTGSGKTEVYLQAITPILQRGQSVLVLVPEIGLTPQLTDRFRARFGDRIRVYHSALSEGERYDTWRSLLDAEPQVVIGTRSAVFAPLANLGLIVLDEEHDSGYKQDQPAPCYHARMVARWRSQQQHCPLLLGSATPCLETWLQTRSPTNLPDQPLSHLSEATSRYHYLALPHRVHARPMPPIEVIDMRQELAEGNRSIFSHPLQMHLNQLQARQQQGLLFIHRRGHSTFVSCRSCGYVAECPHCSVSLTYHHSPDLPQSLLRCHYCNHTQGQPQRCPVCQSSYFRFFGSGTQRVMEELQKKFPTLRVIRFDSDTTRRKGAHRQLLDQFARGEADLMVGTQMLTKGIDLPQVQLVAVLAADSLLNLPDFRASERTFQTLLQVAGRAGRGQQPGRVFLQTYSPEHPVIEAVQQYAFQPFVEAELSHRQASGYPPFKQLMVLRLSGLDPQLVEATAQTLATYLQDYLQTQQLPGELLGPTPASIFKVAQRYSWHLLLKLPANSAGTMPAWSLPVSELLKRCPAKLRLSIDVDPLKLL